MCRYNLNLLLKFIHDFSIIVNNNLKEKEIEKLNRFSALGNTIECSAPELCSLRINQAFEILISDYNKSEHSKEYNELWSNFLLKVKKC